MDNIVLKGNKGDWAEPYAFLKCLGDGRIYGADGDQNRRDDVFYDVRSVARSDLGHRRDYILDKDEKVIVIKDGDDIVLTMPVSEFQRQYTDMFDAILTTPGRAFRIPESEEFLESIGITKIKAGSGKKADISIRIFEPQVGIEVEQGFSIKSILKSPATLINASAHTNIDYEIVGNINDTVLSAVNSILCTKDKRRYESAFRILDANGMYLKFDGFCSTNYNDNLLLIGQDIPIIAAEMVRLWFWERDSDIVHIVQRMKEINPLGFPNPYDKPFYEKRVKDFLTAHALGLKPADRWDGKEEANGGYIIVKLSGEVLCYHIYEREDFQEYLFKNTKMETPDSRNGFGRIFQKDGRWFVRLNLQVRFKQ